MMLHAIAMSLIITINTAQAAQLVCGQREELIEVLETKYHEISVATGIQSTRVLFEVFVSPKGTWTVLVTSPLIPTIACIKATGDSWEDMTLHKKGRPT